MAITNNPDLNMKLNKNSGDNISKPRYCKHCGKQIIYSTTNKDGSVDTTLDYRWKNMICDECIGRDTDNSNQKYKRF